MTVSINYILNTQYDIRKHHKEFAVLNFLLSPSR